MALFAGALASALCVPPAAAGEEAESAAEASKAGKPRSEVAKASPKAGKPAAGALSIYIPSKSYGRAEEGGRVGGGTRGEGTDSLPRVVILAPGEGVGLTTQKQPTLHWYLSQDTDLRVDVTLIDEDSIDPLLEVTLPGPVKAGIHAIDLAEHGIELAIGERYVVFVTVIPDPEARSSDVLTGAPIRRVEPAPELATALAGEQPRYAVLGRNGIWFDAVDALAEAIAARPGDGELKAIRNTLMAQQDIALPESL